MAGCCSSLLPRLCHLCHRLQHPLDVRYADEEGDAADSTSVPKGAGPGVWMPTSAANFIAFDADGAADIEKKKKKGASLAKPSLKEPPRGKSTIVDAKAETKKKRRK